jgi:metallophosphoesterase (TIGR00282 family)
MTAETYRRIIAAGADIITSGNHVWEKRDFLAVLDGEDNILRPANYPSGASGQGWARVDKDQVGGGPPLTWIVVNLQGRELMNPIDCPFRCFDAILNNTTAPAGEVHALFTPEGAMPESLQGMNPFVLVDFHAESSREKEALGYYLDGRASLIVGTHTHVQTTDERILPRGTGYITDLGMTGAVNGIIGMDTRICLDRVRTQIAYRMECATGEAALQGIIAAIDGTTGNAVSIERLNVSGGPQ